jgi:hypothetical protein
MRGPRKTILVAEEMGVSDNTFDGVGDYPLIPAEIEADVSTDAEQIA